MTVETLQNLNYFLALGGLLTIVIGVSLLIDMFNRRIFEKYISRWGNWTMFALAFVSVFFTSIYSGVFGVVPCGLCWFERIFLYPQVLIISVGLYFKDELMPKYIIVLSAFGFIISLYHHYIQMGGNEFITCPTVSVGTDCAKRFLFEFGFITFPLLATIMFGFLMIIAFYILRVRSNSSQQADSFSGQD